MKRFLSAFLIIVLAFSVLSLSSCGDDKKDETKSEQAKTSSQSDSSKSGANTGKKTNSDIQSYLDSFVEGDSDFYGAWKYKDMQYLTIIFRNDNLAEMVMGGSEGYFSKYTLNESKKTISLQLIPDAIDGIYTYEFSNDNKILTLTRSEDKDKLVFTKQENFTIVPKSPKNPKIDKNIIGWWESKSKDGLFYCFQDNGVMYENSISMETCYTYNAENGKIKAVYSSAGEMKEDFTYSFKNDELTLNGTKYTRKNME